MITLESVNRMQELALVALQYMERGVTQAEVNTHGMYRYLTDSPLDRTPLCRKLILLCEFSLSQTTDDERMLFLAFLVTLPTQDLQEMLA